MLEGKKILLGITGSIAAYKAPLIVRQLIAMGSDVKVIMTPAATDFVSKLTLSTLSKNPVLTDLFDEETWANHVMLGRWADIMLIAPLSCNTLSKLANGQCDNLLLATYLSATCPVMIAPAMDEDMWHHAATRNNMETVQSQGCRVIPVEHGELASGLIGDGRMAQPETIIAHLHDFFSAAHQLKGKKAIVTAGPTYEAIDPVRFIGNHSSGKMGFAIAEELSGRGADVTLIAGPVSQKLRNSSLRDEGGVKKINVTSADDMYRECLQREYDIAVMAAAVADYTPVNVSDVKIKKGDDDLTLKLKKTKDVLKSLGDQKKNGQVLVGFALETNNERENAKKKLHEKNADIIVLNSLQDEGAAFAHDTNKVTLFFKNGNERSIELKSKTSLAKDIVDSIIELLK